MVFEKQVFFQTGLIFNSLKTHEMVQIFNDIVSKAIDKHSTTKLFEMTNATFR